MFQRITAHMRDLASSPLLCIQPRASKQRKKLFRTSSNNATMFLCRIAELTCFLQEPRSIFTIFACFSVSAAACLFVSLTSVSAKGSELKGNARTAARLFQRAFIVVSLAFFFVPSVSTAAKATNLQNGCARNYYIRFKSYEIYFQFGASQSLATMLIGFFFNGMK